MNPVYVWDLTLKWVEDLTPLDVHRVLRQWCKKYTFQLEQGAESGYKHYQLRLSFIKKRREGEAGKWLQEVGWQGHFSPTVKENTATAFYMMKAETRLEGPWSEKDYMEPPVRTWQLEKFLERPLQPWMVSIKDMIKTPDMRHIVMIVNHVGNKGKSLFVEHMEYEGLAYEAPPINSFDDLMQALHGIPPQNCYMVDMPRGMKGQKLNQFFSGIEYLKNGVTYDKRYAFKKRRMGRPHIFIFTNTIPKINLLSTDRWQFYTIKEHTGSDYLEKLDFSQMDDGSESD